MTNNTPQEMLKKVNNLDKAIKASKKKSVAVGLPVDKIGNPIYSTKNNQQSIITVGAFHEYGTQQAPQRSFLRVPFSIEKKKINSFISAQYKKSLNGFDVDDILGSVGAYCTNVSKKSFTNNGYGQWAPLKASTIKAKGSSKALIDTGTLRNSITWSVRND